MKKEMMSKSELLNRGWTKKSIDLLLPAPTTKTNPHYKNSAPMLLWDKEEVEKMENTPEFQEAKAKKLKRTDIASKAVETKTQKLLDEISQYKVTIQKVSNNQLLEYTLGAKEQWYFNRGNYGFTAYGADEETIQRWEVNFIRHNLTEYDIHCLKLFGKVGKYKAHNLLKNTVLDEIAKAYPHLAAECELQKINNS